MAKKSAHGEGTFEKVGKKIRLVRMVDRQTLKGPLATTKPEAREAWNRKFLERSPSAPAANLTLSSALSRLFPEDEQTTPLKLVALQSWRPTTYDVYRRQATHLLESSLANLRLSSIDERAIARYVQKECAGLEPVTVGHKLFLLRAVFRFLGVEPPPIKLPKRAPPKQRPIVEIEEKEAFYACFHGEMEQLAFRLMLSCGLSRSEACGLAHEDREDDGIVIRRATTRQTGRNNVDLPKARRRNRWVPLVDPYLLERIGKGTGFVLDSGFEGHPLNPEILTNLVAHRLKGTKWEGIKPHDLRRSAATAYAMKGVPVHIAAKNLGHSVQMMLEIYAQISRDDEREAARKALG